MLLSPQTIRSGRTPPSVPPRLRSAVSACDACDAQAGVEDHARLHHGDRDVPDGRAGRGERERQRPGADAGHPGGHAQDREPRPPRSRRAGRPRRSAAGTPATMTMATFASTSAKLISHTPPTEARASTAGMLPLADAEHGPRAAERLPGPQPLGEQPAARHHHQGGQRPRPVERRAQQLLRGHPERYPQHAEHHADQQHRRADLRRHPVQRRDQVPGPEPPGAHPAFPRRG